MVGAGEEAGPEEEEGHLYLHQHLSEPKFLLCALGEFDE